MEIENVKTELYKRIPRLREYFLREYEVNLEHEEIRETLGRFVDLKIERLIEDADEILFNPQYEMHQELISLLPNKNIFSGKSEYSQEKMAAMFVLLTSLLQVKWLSKTRFNKLAFYSDFRNYAQTGKSISGSAYRHLPHGPVIDNYESVINELELNGFIAKESRTTKFGESEALVGKKMRKDLKTDLTTEEIKTLESVVRDFGGMSAAKISDLSHEELAYKNTRTGELIAYGYSKFLKH